MTVLLLVLAGCVPASAVTFATRRLAAIARCLSLSDVDTLSAATATDCYRYQGHALTVRKNRLGEIDHIGLKLFPQAMRDAAPSPVYDFLERDFLERNLNGLDAGLRHHLATSHLSFVVGNARTPLSFRGDEQFTEESIDMKRYRATWTRAGREVLTISFDMDYEMLSGCNAIELEEQYVRRLKRFVPTQSPQPSEPSSVPDGMDAYVVRGDSFLIREMRNDIFLERDSTGWHLINRTDSPERTLSNMMLSPLFEPQSTVQLMVDKYGYASECVELPYRHFLLMAVEEGCTPYFGVKTKNGDGSYSGTLMLVNRKGGYVHMLSAIVPVTSLAAGSETVFSGRLLLYIPIFNVSDRFFEQNKN